MQIRQILVPFNQRKQPVLTGFMSTWYRPESFGKRKLFRKD